MKKITFFVVLFSFNLLLANSDKYRLIITDNPSATITVAWNQISGSSPVVYYGTTDHGTDWTQYALNKTVDRTISFRGMSNQFARITGLTPNTIYYFVIKDSQGTSQRFWFRTAPNDLSRLSFIAGGDSRNNRAPRQNANKLVSKLKPHAVLFGGDMTNSDNDIQWQEWFDDWQLTTSSDGRMIPIIPVRGNHENAATVYNLFDTSNPDQYYSITFGNNLFTAFCLNSEISVAGNQLTWLTNELQSNTSIWKGAQYHKPMRPHNAAKSEGTHVYNAWANLFYDNEVRMVVDCDSHTVKSTWPVKPSTEAGSDEGFIRDDSNGTVYLGEGCWGAPLRSNDDPKDWTRDTGSFNQFKLIFIDEDKIEARTIKVDNADSVGEVTNTDPFTLPSNLDVWNPSNGNLVEIFKNSLLPSPEIAFSTISSGNCYVTGDNISYDIQVDNEGSGISKVDFYIDGSLSHTDFTPPFTYDNILPDGVHSLIAIATDINNRTDSTNAQIYVGSFTSGSTFPIISGDDDVEESQAGLLYTDSSDLEMVYDSYNSNNYQKIGLRFQAISIPQGAAINSAYIQFRSDETNSASAFLNIAIEDSNDAGEYVEALTNSLTSGRTYFGTTVSWNPAPWNATGEVSANQQTPSLTTLVQEIINKPEWNSGNSIAFLITGTGNSLTNTSAKRVADSYEGSSTNPATLVVNYSYVCENSPLSENSSVKNNSDIILYPNPTKDVLNFSIPSTINGTLRFNMYDINGKNVYNVEKDTFNNIISFESNLSNGLYLIKIFDSENNLLKIEKVIIR